MHEWTRRVAEALLDERLDDLYEHAPCGYVSLLPDGLVGRVNATFADWIGIAKDDLIGRRRFTDLLAVGSRIYYETHFQPLVRMQHQVREIAMDLVHRDGERLPALVNARQHDYPHVGIITRLSVFPAGDRRRYEQELLAATRRAEQDARSKADLVAATSHDIRAPLSAMTTALALLDASSPTPAQARYIRVLRSSASHALALVNELLDFSRLEAGRVVIREEPFSLRGLAEEAVASARAAALQKSDLAITAAVDPAVPSMVIGNRAHFRQVLTNLMMNAVKFTDRGFAALAIHQRAATEADVTLELTVRDSGIGIAPDQLSRIFEEYTQANDDIGRHYGGTGLGLAISRRILRLHDSDLTVTSTVGEGTTFSFTVTLQRAPATG